MELPLELVSQGLPDSAFCICNAEGYTVADTHDEAAGRALVKCANHHDALVAMVQRLLERYRCDDSMGDAVLADAADDLLAAIGGE